MYPNDKDFEETTLAEVAKEKSGGWSIKRADGWSFWVPANSPIEPKVDMKARFYGKGIGFQVRGLFLDGVKVYYRTEAEDKEHSEVAMYGADAAEWLRRWDTGDTVWTIEMGGLGPGYEQCIHITCAEILRHMLASNYLPELWDEKEVWKQVCAEIEEEGFKNPTIKALGLSGAQWGAAMNIATMLYRDGPRSIMADERVKDRHIQVKRTFPQAVAA